MKTVKWLPYSDQVVVLSSEGGLSQLGTFQSLVSVPGYLHDLKLNDNEEMNSSFAAEQEGGGSKPESLLPEGNARDTETAENRGRRDPRNLLYYISSMGKPLFAVFLCFVTLECIFIALQRECTFYTYIKHLD